MLGIGFVIRHYDWGSRDALPALLGREPDGLPWAEAWLGDHPLGPAPIVEPDAAGFHLDRLIRRDPATTLGPDHERWGDRLPYLLKLLAVEQPLSLQVHPGSDRAREGFARESAAGMPIDAHGRSYKDSSHKPEMVLALTSFDALVGFRPLTEVRSALAPLDSLLARDVVSLMDGPNPVRQVLAVLLGGDVAPGAVSELVEACARCRETGEGDLAAYSTVTGLAAHYPGDPGLAVSLFMRRVTMAPGEALFVPTGTLHSYLRGVVVEVQAASDNVLRAGLTPKHLDIPELLACVDTGHGAPCHPRESRTGEVRRFDPPVSDFRLAEVRLAGPVEVDWRGPRIVVALEGSVIAATGAHTRRISAGQAAFVLGSDGPLRLHGTGRVVVAAPGQRDLPQSPA
ncbi:MAG: mannose-6-phosphate isomerase, class I [Bifidobacteriaceae bacterium]|jgi:mannose-6-phosphate isomerase|nr:mannose-6-phosphate isomerase, class I [Bifidobacteriaceae bacterium]